jgi:hypothetical protein
VERKCKEGAAAITKEVVESWFMSKSGVVMAEARGEFGITD